MLNREHPKDPGTSVGKGRWHLYCYLVGRKQGVTNQSQVALAEGRVAWEGTVVEEGDSDLAVGRRAWIDKASGTVSSSCQHSFESPFESPGKSLPVSCCRGQIVLQACL